MEVVSPSCLYMPGRPTLFCPNYRLQITDYRLKITILFFSLFSFLFSLSSRLLAPGSRLHAPCSCTSHARIGHATAPVSREGYVLLATACFAPRTVQAGAIPPRGKHNININIRDRKVFVVLPAHSGPFIPNLAGRRSPARLAVSGSWGTPTFLRSFLRSSNT